MKQLNPQVLIHYLKLYSTTNKKYLLAVVNEKINAAAAKNTLTAWIELIYELADFARIVQSKKGNDDEGMFCKMQFALISYIRSILKENHHADYENICKNLREKIKQLSSSTEDATIKERLKLLARLVILKGFQDVYTTFPGSNDFIDYIQNLSTESLKSADSAEDVECLKDIFYIVLYYSKFADVTGLTFEDFESNAMEERQKLITSARLDGVLIEDYDPNKRNYGAGLTTALANAVLIHSYRQVSNAEKLSATSSELQTSPASTSTPIPPPPATPPTRTDCPMNRHQVLRDIWLKRRGRVQQQQGATISGEPEQPPILMTKSINRK